MRALTLRSPTDPEWSLINKLAASRTAPAAQVRRAQLLKHLAQGASAPQAAALVGALTAETARNLLKGVPNAVIRSGRTGWELGQEPDGYQ